MHTVRCPRLLSKTLTFLLTAAAMSCSALSPDERQTDQTPPDPGVRVRDCEGPATSLPAELAATLEPRAPSTTQDERGADMARQVPGGFAGILYDNGRPVLMLTRPEEAAAAKAELAPLLHAQSPGFDVAGAEVRPARWDFAQLHDWQAYLLKQGLSRSGSGVNRSGKDELANRISFGVMDAAARAPIADEIDALGVPCDLVLVKITSPLRGLSVE